MALHIDYYLAPHSPWTYLGHARLVQIAADSGATVQVRPCDWGQVFAASGGLPLGQRAPQRQAYRLVELARFRDALALPLNLKPRFFPVAGDLASRLIIAAAQAHGATAALRLAGRLLAGVWMQERDISDAPTLAALLAEAGLPDALLQAAQSTAVHDTYALNTRQALDSGVFGAPSYVVDGEIFWGQDRLDFLQQRLLRGTAAAP